MLKVDGYTILPEKIVDLKLCKLPFISVDLKLKIISNLSSPCQLIVGLHHPNGFDYVDDTWVVIKQNELDCFFDHINQVDPHNQVYTGRPQGE